MQVDTAIPARDDPSVVYYGRGVHELPWVDAEAWHVDKGSRGHLLSNDTTYYLEEGAVVLGLWR